MGEKPLITVAILINGKTVTARSARNIGEKNGEAMYLVDDGTVIYHKPGDGPVALAKKLLSTIKG